MTRTQEDTGETQSTPSYLGKANNLDRSFLWLLQQALRDIFSWGRRILENKIKEPDIKHLQPCLETNNWSRSTCEKRSLWNQTLPYKHALIKGNSTEFRIKSSPYGCVHAFDKEGDINGGNSLFWLTVPLALVISGRLKIVHVSKKCGY